MTAEESVFLFRCVADSFGRRFALVNLMEEKINDCLSVILEHATFRLCRMGANGKAA